MYGLDQEQFKDWIDVNYEYPSKVAQLLIDGHTEIGLVPVAAIPNIPNAQIIGEYGIAADGPVKSVCLYSDVPIHEIQRVYLDYQSRTSVRLCKLLFDEYWNKEVEWLAAPKDYINKIEGNTAGVIIGDRALEQLNNFKYVYDLSFYWKEHTGLPFVFAAWVANRSLSTKFVEKFNEACALGFHHLEEIVEKNNVPYYDLYKYYTQDIKYNLDEHKKKGLSLFLQKIQPSYQLNFHQHDVQY